MGIQMGTDEIEAIIRGIGQQIRDCRKQKKISAADLAKSVGLGRMTINRIEAGEPGVSLANVLKVSGALALDLDMETIVKPEGMLLKMMQIQAGKSKSGKIDSRQNDVDDCAGMAL